MPATATTDALPDWRSRRGTCGAVTMPDPPSPRRDCLTDPQRPRLGLAPRRIRVEHDDEMRARGGIGRLAQPSERQHPPARNLAGAVTSTSRSRASCTC